MRSRSTIQVGWLCLLELENIKRLTRIFTLISMISWRLILNDKSFELSHWSLWQAISFFSSHTSQGQITAALNPLGWTLAVVPELDDLTVGGLFCRIANNLNFPLG